jgi:hypothetical protein
VAEKLSSGLRFLALRDVQKIFGLRSLDAARDLLNHFKPCVPTFTYDRTATVPVASGDGHPALDKTVTFREEKVLAMALELAMFSYLLPGGPGIHLDANVPPKFTAIPEATRQLSGAMRCLDYWALFRKNPHALQLMVALSALMYGPQDMKELLKRLWALGDFIIQEAGKHCGPRGTTPPVRRKPKHERAIRARRLEQEEALK